MVKPITSMKDAFSLKGKKAIITGGNRGLGRAIALAMAECGADVAILCRDAAKAAETLGELKAFGGHYESFSCDVSDIKDVRRAVAEAWGAFSGFDILVNNAGIGAMGELLDMDEEMSGWFDVINTNLHGCARMTYEVGKRMRDAGKGGAIINITSNAADIVNKTQSMASYSASKAAENHFTRCMAVELGKYDIRVNAIAPGFTNTELSKHIPPDQFDYIINQMPVGRFGEPIEVGALAVYLASPASVQMTGSIVTIDGGYVLTV